MTNDICIHIKKSNTDRLIEVIIVIHNYARATTETLVTMWHTQHIRKTNTTLIIIDKYSPPWTHGGRTKGEAQEKADQTQIVTADN